MALPSIVAEGRGLAQRTTARRVVQIPAGHAIRALPRNWLDDGLTTRQAAAVENYQRLADHAIGKLGAVKVKDLTARQVQKALAELSASPSTRCCAASAQHQAYKIARPRGTAPLAAGS
jgi:hypothetical protein